MPYIEAKLSIKLDDKNKNELQLKLTDVVSEAFSKPKMYIMTNIEDEKTMYMSEKKMEKGAYISVSLLGIYFTSPNISRLNTYASKE